MSDGDFCELVLQMRTAQRRYFKRKDNLQECKSLDKQVDEALEGRDRSLFDEAPLDEGDNA